MTGEKFRVAIAVARFNETFNQSLLEGCRQALREGGCDSPEISWVPGAVELPLVAQRYAQAGYDAVIALGTVIRGDTPHFDYVCSMAADGCLRVSLDSGVPVIFGVLTCDDVAQAIARTGEAPANNKGYDSGVAALEMARLLHTLPGKQS